MDKKHGFTLIELMIVVAIIAIIAAISLPNLLRSRMAANEANAIGGIRSISSAEIQYRAALISTVNGVGAFGTLSELNATDPPFIDEVLGQDNAIKSGYQFNVVDVDPTTAAAPSFVATALRLNERTGTRAFFVDESGVVRFIVGDGPATSTDSPLN